jgi:hypothetical protein
MYKLLKGDVQGVISAWNSLGPNINENVPEQMVLWYITGYLIAKGVK